MAIALVLTAAALAGPVGAAGSDDWQGFQLNLDNDLLAGRGDDRWYTNGIRLSWTYKSGPENAATRLTSELANKVNWLNRSVTLTYTVGQLMYTPRNIRIATPQPLDRPWGAFLFAGVTAHAYEGANFSATDLKLGVVGPAALGRQAQKLVHEIIHADPPQGWQHQLRPRPGVQLSHMLLHRFGDSASRDFFGFQVGGGGAVGTLRNYLSLNVGMTLGQLDGPNAPLVIANEGDFVVQDHNNRAQFNKLFGFVGASATVVAHNHFLRGRTGTYGRSQIDPRHGYAMLQWGVSLPTHRLGRCWPRLVYAQTLRTPEFDSPALGRDEGSQRWGTLTANWDFD